jgi:hypothetical protein
MARTSKSNAPVTDRDVLADIYLNTNCYKVPAEGQRSSNSHFETFVLNLELSKAFMLKFLNDRMQVPAS